jgi:prepilin-type N-terminal cleavage/methylation domain-containing protein/prepilin-type processing-associated H-X9-DG protein
MPHRVLRRRRNHSSATPSPVTRRTAAAFTLAELLIVIAIIGVLISILLPTLGAARRSANAAKCLAAMRDLGLAFQQYAQDNKRAFPVVEYWPPATQLSPWSPQRRPWQDFLVKYVHKKDPTYTGSPPSVALDSYRPNSVLWGCPAFDPDNWFSATIDPGLNNFNVASPNKFNTGYGMSRFVLAPYTTLSPPPPGFTTQRFVPDPNGPGNFAIFRDGGSPRVEGQFFKMETWGKRAAERGLLADCNNYDLFGSAAWAKADMTANPPTAKCDPFLKVQGDLTGSYINVDGLRHTAPTANRKKILTAKGVNMLFVDGHATPVSPEEAWIAVRGGGMDARN